MRKAPARSQTLMQLVAGRASGAVEQEEEAVEAVAMVETEGEGNDDRRRGERVRTKSLKELQRPAAEGRG